MRAHAHTAQATPNASDRIPHARTTQPHARTTQQRQSCHIPHTQRQTQVTTLAEHMRAAQGVRQLWRQLQPAAARLSRQPRVRARETLKTSAEKNTDTGETSGEKNGGRTRSPDARAGGRASAGGLLLFRTLPSPEALAARAHSTRRRRTNLCHLHSPPRQEVPYVGSRACRWSLASPRPCCARSSAPRAFRAHRALCSAPCIRCSTLVLRLPVGRAEFSTGMGTQRHGTLCQARVAGRARIAT